jgi:hypothetical protein
MALNHRFLAHSPEEIFAVLAEPELYDRFVVGTISTAATDDTWPEPGSMLRHQQGVGPFRLTDVTTVREVAEPTMVTLDAQLRPLLSLEVRFTLEPAPGGTLVWMREEVTGGLLRFAGRLADTAIRLRNDRTLDRLERLTSDRRADRT